MFPTEPANISVIVPQFGQMERTARLVTQLRRYEDPAVEILVVDDGSPERDAFPWSTRCETVNLRQDHAGVTAAWNLGALLATGRLLVFLNNDVEVSGPFLKSLVRPLQTDSADIAGVEARREASLPNELLSDSRRQLLAGWCFAIRRRLFEQLGGFDRTLRLYFSDTDLQWRLLERPGSLGLKVVTGLLLKHFGQGTTRHSADRKTLWTADRDRFIAKWGRNDRTPFESRRAGRRTVRPHLVQIANSGRITGGTGACAWTVTRALPDWKHTVLFRSPVDAETRRAFAPVDVFSQGEWNWPALGRFEPDLFLLHNISSHTDLLKPYGRPSVNFLHSKIIPMPATRTVCCSEWLRQQLPGHRSMRVLYQAVPAPPQGDEKDSRALRDELIVGRLCTPTLRKWPDSLIDWYRALADELPAIRWEFVGCPLALQAELQRSCQGAATFYPASFEARRHLWRWDALLYHHPTLTESFGRTVAEAMRAGCIPIVDDRGGFREQMADETGILCGDREAFRQALRAIHDPGVRLRRSRRCRADADESFSLERFRRDLLTVFQQALTARCASGSACPSRRPLRDPARW